MRPPWVGELGAPRELWKRFGPELALAWVFERGAPRHRTRKVERRARGTRAWGTLCGRKGDGQELEPSPESNLTPGFPCQERSAPAPRRRASAAPQPTPQFALPSWRPHKGYKRAMILGIASRRGVAPAHARGDGLAHPTVPWAAKQDFPNPGWGALPGPQPGLGVADHSASL